MTKQVYRIREVAAIAGVPTSTLRYWEREFKQLAPSRTESGQRRYSETDLKLCLTLKELLHDKDLSVSTAKEMLDAGYRKYNPRGAYVCNTKKDALGIVHDLIKMTIDNKHITERLRAIELWMEREE